MKRLSYFIVLIAFSWIYDASAQWSLNGNSIYNTNSGNVGIGLNSPATLLHVAKNMTEPVISVQNLGGTGGATYRMTDNASGADWKFKATSTGGFKIRDNANALDVIVIEPNSAANAFYINSAGNVGIGTSNPVESAALEINNTTRGFLPPRMDHLQRNAIANPVAGLVIWCNNCGTTGELQVYNGNAWTNMIGGSATPGLAIGVIYQGGIIAYILQPGDPGYIAGENHGLIAAPSDQGTFTEWGCWGEPGIAGADGTAIGTGNQNTIDIMAGCSTAGIAARLCGDLVLNGYTDWYLPSKDELEKLYINRAIIGNFAGDYWSSSEYSDPEAWHQPFYYGWPLIFDNKYYALKVRAIRAF